MDETIKKNIEAYDVTVEEYYEFTKELEPPEIIHRKDFLALIKKNGKILDLCCGPGRDARIFSEQGYEVIGVDLSQNMIKKAKQIAPKAKFQVMDLLEIDFPDKSFDAVWFNAGLLAVPKKHDLDILKKVHDILVDEGILWISVKQGEGEMFKERKQYKVKKFYAFHTKKEMQNLLKESGFKILKTYEPEMKSEYHKEQRWLGFLCKKKTI